MHTLWLVGHIVCIKAPKNILPGLFPTMKLKIQLSAHDVEFQRQERAKSDQITKQLLIPQEKVPTIIKFKSPTFVFPTPKGIVLPKKNHLTSLQSNLEFPSFLPKKNYFLFLKQRLLIWIKETLLFYLFYLLLPPSPPSLLSSLALLPPPLQLSATLLPLE